MSRRSGGGGGGCKSRQGVEQQGEGVRVLRER